MLLDDCRSHFTINRKRLKASRDNLHKNGWFVITINFYLAFCHGELEKGIKNILLMLLVRSAHNYRLLFKTNCFYPTTSKEKVVIVFSVKLESRCTRRPWKAATCILTLLAKGSVSWFFNFLHEPILLRQDDVRFQTFASFQCRLRVCFSRTHGDWLC